jgi:hypothetical protein
MKLFKQLKQIDDAWSAPFNRRFPRLGKVADRVEKHAYPIFGTFTVLFMILAVWTCLHWDLGLFIASVIGLSLCVFVLAMFHNWKSGTTLLLIISLLALAPSPAAAAAQNHDEPRGGDVHADNLGLAICAVVFIAGILVIGGCMYKKAKSIPVRQLPPEDGQDPPTPPAPPCTNAPPRKTSLGIAAPVDDAGRGIARWDLTTSTRADYDPFGRRYTDLLTVSILGQPDLGTPPEPVGSRMIWIATQPAGDSITVHSVLIVHYDGRGAAIDTNYYSADASDCPLQFESSAVKSQIELTDAELAGNRFFRLATPVDHIGILARKTQLSDNSSASGRTNQALRSVRHEIR